MIRTMLFTLLMVAGCVASFLLSILVVLTLVRPALEIIRAVLP
jgi:hypothetical protein